MDLLPTVNLFTVFQCVLWKAVSTVLHLRKQKTLSHMKQKHIYYPLMNVLKFNKQSCLFFIIIHIHNEDK